MRRSRRKKTTDIDITPLIDVLFMLIIFFVLTTSFVQGKIDVELPSGKGETQSSEKAITVSVEKDGKISWDDRRVTKEELSSLATLAREKEILIAGDRESSYGAIAEILSILKTEGVSSVGLLLRGEDK